MSQNDERKLGGKRRRRRRKNENSSSSGGGREEGKAEQVERTHKVLETRNVWKIKNEQDGGREYYIDGTYYHYGDTLPKLNGKLFKDMRQAGHIEVIEDSMEVEQ